MKLFASNHPTSTLAAILLATLFLTGCAHSSDPSPDLFEHVRPAAVEIIVDGHLYGSGWFADSQGRVITASHVVVTGRTFEVVDWRQNRFAAQVVAMDRGNDLALLETGLTGTPFLATADRIPPPGSTAFNFGAPIYRHSVMLRGAVARAEPAYEYLPDQKDYMRIFHFTAAAPPGTSGGCWLDLSGRVIGNQVGVMFQDGRWIGIAYVAPLDSIERLLRTRKSIPSASLNIAVEELTEHNSTTVAKYAPYREGLLVVVVHERGAGDEAGVKNQELIVEADGKRVRYRDELLSIVRAHKPGDILSLTVIATDGKTRRSVTARLHDFAQVTPKTRPASRPSTQPASRSFIRQLFP